jgi:hypothetical protein
MIYEMWLLCLGIFSDQPNITNSLLLERNDNSTRKNPCRIDKGLYYNSFIDQKGRSSSCPSDCISAGIVADGAAKLFTGLSISAP